MCFLSSVPSEKILHGANVCFSDREYFKAELETLCSIENKYVILSKYEQTKCFFQTASCFRVCPRFCDVASARERDTQHANVLVVLRSYAPGREHCSCPPRLRLTAVVSTNALCRSPVHNHRGLWRKVALTACGRSMARQYPLIGLLLCCCLRWRCVSSCGTAATRPWMCGLLIRFSGVSRRVGLFSSSSIIEICVLR